MLRDLDAVTANCATMGSVSVLVNDGTGKFALASYEDTSFPIAVAQNPVAVAVADFNGDGALDIIVGHALVTAAGSKLSVLLAQP